MKDFWEKWEFGLWRQDTAVAMLSEPSRCFWFEALNCMFERSTYKLSGSPEQLAAATRCKVVVVTQAIAEIETQDVADVHKQNGSITIISRKRLREHSISEKRSLAGAIGGSKRQATCEHIVEQTSISSSKSDSTYERSEYGAPPFTPEEWAAAVKSLQCLPDDAKACWAYYDSQGWHKANGRAISGDPRSLLTSWLANPQRTEKQHGTKTNRLGVGTGVDRNAGTFNTPGHYDGFKQKPLPKT